MTAKDKIIKPATEVLLELRGLKVTFRRDAIELPVVRGLDLRIARGERSALVGESGCGKSISCMALTRLPPLDQARLEGEISFNGVKAEINEHVLESWRGGGVAYVFQDASASLNPVMRVGEQISEVLSATAQARRRPKPARRQLREQVLRLLSRVRLPMPQTLLRAYPCELSGGMQQRVMLAMALASEPQLLVADEPTTALDVTTQAEVLDLIDTLVEASGMALLLVTHNLALVAGRCQTMYVMYAGQIIESGATAQLLSQPAHPYTAGLLRAVPRLDGVASLRDIPGTVPPPDQLPAGCAFAARCPRRDALCDAQMPDLRPLAKQRLCRCHHPLWEADK